MKTVELYIVALLCLLAITLASCGPETPTPLKPAPSVGISPTVVLSSPRPVQATGAPTSGVTTVATGTSTPLITPIPAGTPPTMSITTETAQPAIYTTPGTAPTVVVNPGINIIRQQYDDALAKWRSQRIEAYEVVVQYSSFSPYAGTWDLRVNGGQIDVVSYSKDGVTPITPVAPTTGDTLNFLTVDARFAVIEHRLTALQLLGVDAEVDYVVAFDPTLGYPISIEIKQKPGVARPDVESKTVVKSLAILKQGGPSAPQATSSVTSQATVTATQQATAVATPQAAITITTTATATAAP